MSKFTFHEALRRPQQINVLLKEITESPGPPVAEEKAPFVNKQRFWKEQKYGQGSRRGPKPRITVLATTISKLLLSSLSLNLYLCFYLALYHHQNHPHHHHHHQQRTGCPSSNTVDL
jgi:hypothetical protein